MIEITQRQADLKIPPVFQRKPIRIAGSGTLSADDEQPFVFLDESNRSSHGGSATKMPLAKDLLNPSVTEEKQRHKKKRLVQSPNSYFMDVKCPGCYKITTVFSHAQTVVLCVGCSTVLCQPTGGKARLTEGCSFRRKQH
ncbi:40S ribosomal protein S27-like [Polypterus senegalus]|nr:40S ribosomal protein S27-like [Polypterus senegalus]